MLACEVGVEVMKKGGNAVDAAVAVGYALAVTYPAAGNLGGGGFMTLALADGRRSFIDFREKAPLKATRDMYLGADGERHAGAVDARRARHRDARHGRRARICARALRLAAARRADRSRDQAG